MPEEIKILALETSCDETACAIAKANIKAKANIQAPHSSRQGQLLTNNIASQIRQHEKFGGVVPELASRMHLQNAEKIINIALQQAKIKIAEIDAFSATTGPGLASSLLIGTTIAKGLALSTRKPFFSINHMEGHLLSPFIKNQKFCTKLDVSIPPHISLIVSGGHTQLLDIETFGKYKLLGTTRDDAAGEAFDKAGKMLGLPYPGGVEIDKRARTGNRQAFKFPMSMLKGKRNFEFSFSGLKTSLLYKLEKIEKPAEVLNDLCASFQETICQTLWRKAKLALDDTGKKIIAISGGVSCNSRLRQLFLEKSREHNFQLHLPESQYTTDNAGMIAHATILHFIKEIENNSDNNFSLQSLESDVNPNLAIYSK